MSAAATETTAALPAAPAGVGVLGPGPARVDLMPAEVLASRRLVRTQKILVVAMAGVLALAGGSWWAAHAGAAAASTTLHAEQMQGVALQAQKTRYAEVPRVQERIDQVRAAERGAMAADVRWSQVVDAVNQDAPPGVWLKDLSVLVAPPAAASGQPAAAVDPLARPAVATLSFTGYASDHDEVAAWLGALTRIPGLSDARYSTASRTDVDGHTVVSFTSTVGVSAAALSHRFEKEGR